METLTLIGTVTLIHLLAVMSPGPDFILACRNALTYSRRTGLWTAVGFGLGIIVHLIYSLAGLAVLISQSILLFTAIKLLGAGYLIYIGIQSLRAKSAPITLHVEAKKEDISALAALRMGFLTNVLNPKATLFFLSVFTMVVSPTTSWWVLGILGTIMVSVTILWFSFVVLCMTQRPVRTLFEKCSGVINKLFGGILVCLGITVAVHN